MPMVFVFFDSHCMSHLWSCCASSGVCDETPGGRELPQLDEGVASSREDVLAVSGELDRVDVGAVVGVGKSGHALAGDTVPHLNGIKLKQMTTSCVAKR